MKNIFEKFILKTNLNVRKMLRYGSVACISMFSIILFFGKNNAMLAFPIALTSITLSFENIRIKTIEKLIKLILLYCFLVLLSFYATNYIYVGIIINFITIFLIAYFLSFSFNPKIYKPFLMLFIFTSFSHDNIKNLSNKIFAIIFGCILVVSLNFILDKKNKNNLLLDFSPSIKLLFNQLKNIKNRDFNLTIYNNISKNMSNINYSIYTTKSSKYLTNLNGKFKLEMFLHISMINNILYEKGYLKNNINQSFFELINIILQTFKENDYNILDTIDNLDKFIQKIIIKISKYSNIETEEFINVLKNISSTLNNYKNTNNKDLKKVFTPWVKTSLRKYKSIFKKNFYKGSIRLNFSLRIATTLTICLFFSHLFELSKIIWIAITIMSVMQIYYEETLNKGKDRIKGNLIGIFIYLFISFLNIKELAWVVLFLSLFLTYGFKEYYKLSIFTTLASLSLTSIYFDINEIAFVRAILVLSGLIIVFFCNKFLFPTHVESGLQILIAKLLFYNREFIHMIKINKYENLADILVLISLTSEKLSLRSSLIKNNKIENLIRINNITIIKLSYYELIK